MALDSHPGPVAERDVYRIDLGKMSYTPGMDIPDDRKQLE